jgi:hypothetical protein
MPMSAAYTPGLGHSDAPHLHYLDLWNMATDDEERWGVCAAAADELDHILKSRGDATKEESAKSRDARIIREGEGFKAQEVAVRFRCGVTTIHTARRNAGRDLEWGTLPRDVDSQQRRAEIERLMSRGSSVRQAAFSLGISYNTARRALGRAA